MTYNALDNIQAVKQLREKLILEQKDLRASLDYEYATTFCSDCPHREHEPDSYEEMEFGVHYAPECCKETLQWDEEHEGAWEHDGAITLLITAIKHYLDNT